MGRFMLNLALLYVLVEFFLALFRTVTTLLVQERAGLCAYFGDSVGFTTGTLAFFPNVYFINYPPFPTLPFFKAKQSCQQNIWRTAWARIMIFSKPFWHMMQMT